MDRQQVVDEARTWLDVPWKHQGRLRTGVDCAGVIIKTAQAVGYSEFDITDYTRNAQLHRLLSYFDEHMDYVNPKDAAPADVGIFRDSAYPCHVGIFSEKNGMLHVIHGHAKRGKVIEEPYELDLKSRIVRAYKFRGIE